MFSKDHIMNLFNKIKFYILEKNLNEIFLLLERKNFKFYAELI